MINLHLVSSCTQQPVKVLPLYIFENVDLPPVIQVLIYKCKRALLTFAHDHISGYQLNFKDLLNNMRREKRFTVIYVTTYNNIVKKLKVTQWQLRTVSMVTKF